jgi:uncharacterized protein YcfJ
MAVLFTTVPRFSFRVPVSQKIKESKMKKILLASVLGAVTLFGGTKSWHETLRVVRSKPVYRTVTIRTPYEECRVRRVPVYRDELDVPAAALLGGFAGGVLGHQVGKGHGRDAATIGGAVVGALVGSNLAMQHRRVSYRKRRICERHYDERRERRLVHYKNIAWYKGHRIVKFSKRPLRAIDVRVSLDY